ncbi:hypothetical protein BDV06DRAFT_74689 [Aspergillus oleicola]
MTYSQAKLLSCNRSGLGVSALRDEKCTVQLLCDEETFRAGEWTDTLTLDNFYTWDFQGDEDLGAGCFIALLSSIFGRCTRVVRGEIDYVQLPPWDKRSEFSEIASLLTSIECHLQSSKVFVVEEYRTGIATS